MKFKLWDGKDLTGSWLISYKIDGVRGHYVEAMWFSRAGKQLHNIPHPKGNVEVAEIFCGSFKESIENTRTYLTKKNIKVREIFSLLPEVDKRLQIGHYTNPTAKEINKLFKQAKKLGHEGLVLKQDDKYLKVKSVETYDVAIIEVKEGKGRNKGRLGKFITNMGGVGTGFSDNERQLWFDEGMVGMVIEVKCMQLTEDGKFRHPRFVRMRPDKLIEEVKKSD